MKTPQNSKPTHLCFECEQLVSELLFLFLEEFMDLVGFDAFAHEFEVGIIFLSELLHQTNVLLLHVLKRLASNIHLTQQSIFLLRERERDRLRIFQQNVCHSYSVNHSSTCLARETFLLSISICSSTERIFLRASSSAIFFPSLLSLSSSSRKRWRSSSACTNTHNMRINSLWLNYFDNWLICW